MHLYDASHLGLFSEYASHQHKPYWICDLAGYLLNAMQHVETWDLVAYFFLKKYVKTGRKKLGKQ